MLEHNGRSKRRDRACDRCRRLKVACHSAGESACIRCAKANKECTAALSTRILRNTDQSATSATQLGRIDILEKELAAAKQKIDSIVAENGITVPADREQSTIEASFGGIAPVSLPDSSAVGSDQDAMLPQTSDDLDYLLASQPGEEKLVELDIFLRKIGRGHAEKLFNDYVQYFGRMTPWIFDLKMLEERGFEVTYRERPLFLLAIIAAVSASDRSIGDEAAILLKQCIANQIFVRERKSISVIYALVIMLVWLRRNKDPRQWSSPMIYSMCTFMEKDLSEFFADEVQIWNPLELPRIRLTIYLICCYIDMSFPGRVNLKFTERHKEAVEAIETRSADDDYDKGLIVQFTALRELRAAFDILYAVQGEYVSSEDARRVKDILTTVDGLQMPSPQVTEALWTPLKTVVLSILVQKCEQHSADFSTFLYDSLHQAQNHLDQAVTTDPYLYCAMPFPKQIYIAQCLGVLFDYETLAYCTSMRNKIPLESLKTQFYMNKLLDIWEQAAKVNPLCKSFSRIIRQIQDYHRAMREGVANSAPDERSVINLVMERKVFSHISKSVYFQAEDDDEEQFTKFVDSENWEEFVDFLNDTSA